MRWRLLACTLLLGGCHAFGDWADRTGDHFPVFNEQNRCEHWQCFTQEGRARSDQIKKENALAKANAPKEAPKPAEPEYSSSVSTSPTDTARH